MSVEHGSRHQPRKRFGQHFLTDASVVASIVDALGPREEQVVVEIGPGLAALTQALLGRVGHLHAIEIDRDLAARLRRRFDVARLTLHEADALAFDYRSIAAPVSPHDGGPAAPAGKLRLVGNLPYNISSPLLVHLLGFRDCIDDQLFMLQKEVVERIVAAPGSRDFGRLSVLLQAYYEIESLFDVPASAFDPPPKVESAVFRMIVRTDRIGHDPLPLQRLLAAGFGQRRKMIRSTLLPWLAANGVSQPGLDPTSRPEQLGVETWRLLADRIAHAGEPAGHDAIPLR